MNRYIVNSKTGRKIFFSKPYEGICEICEKPGGWGEERNICNEAGEKFCLGIDNRNFVHMVALSKKNQLIYIKGKNGAWQTAVITQNMHQIGEIRLSVSEQRKNMFYSVLYEGEWILVHCVLGNGARPQKIARLYNESFYVFEDRVYFSDSEENLCYMDFSDGKPNNVVRICSGTMPYITRYASKIYIAYKNNNALFINDEKFVTDMNAEGPIIVKKDEGFMLMWRSGDFIRYADCENKKVRHIATGVQPDIIICATPSGNDSFYGNFTNNMLKVYPNINLFAPKNKIAENREEIQRLNQLLEEQSVEIRKYREEINKLNNIIYTMSKSHED